MVDEALSGSGGGWALFCESGVGYFGRERTKLRRRRGARGRWIASEARILPRPDFARVVACPFRVFSGELSLEPPPPTLVRSARGGVGTTAMTTRVLRTGRMEPPEPRPQK